MTWIARAHDAVRLATSDLPTEATLAQRRKRLRERGHAFHGGTYWGRKQWGRAVRLYLEQHGLPRRTAAVETSPLFGPDIVFPWRGESTR